MSKSQNPNIPHIWARTEDPATQPEPWRIAGNSGSPDYPNGPQRDNLGSASPTIVPPEFHGGPLEDSLPPMPGSAWGIPDEIFDPANPDAPTEVMPRMPRPGQGR